MSQRYLVVFSLFHYFTMACWFISWDLMMLSCDRIIVLQKMHIFRHDLLIWYFLFLRKKHVHMKRPVYFECQTYTSIGICDLHRYPVTNRYVDAYMCDMCCTDCQAITEVYFNRVYYVLQWDMTFNVKLSFSLSFLNPGRQCCIFH